MDTYAFLILNNLTSLQDRGIYNTIQDQNSYCSLIAKSTQCHFKHRLYNIGLLRTLSRVHPRYLRLQRQYHHMFLLPNKQVRNMRPRSRPCEWKFTTSVFKYPRRYRHRRYFKRWKLKNINRFSQKKQEWFVFSCEEGEKAINFDQSSSKKNILPNLP